MKIQTITLQNWMNFRRIGPVDISDRTFIIGPNAVGKSNFLDALRFLRDVARPAGPRPAGGGLQMAVSQRGGLSKLRCVNARDVTEVKIEIALMDGADRWTYHLGFKGEGRANNRLIVSSEQATRNGKPLFTRPDRDDRLDRERLTQTFLEQISANVNFRPVAHFLGEITYLHLVPQLLKFGDRIAGNVLDQDPFGQSFLRRIAAVNERTRDARLKRIQVTLEKVVSEFRTLRFVNDAITGSPHIEANFKHWRPTGAWQREHQFSDGTLRLIGLLWSLLDGTSLLLLEEPELSLNEEIVSRLPGLISKVQKGMKTPRQVIITTHSHALLTDQSIGAESVLRLARSGDGTVLSKPTEPEIIMLESGLPVGDVLLPATTPKSVDQLEFSLS